MRILFGSLGLLVAAALVWSGYWLWSARQLERDLSAWLAARQADGWQAEATGPEVTGFPLRFDTRVSDIALADPEAGLAWEAPELTLTQPALQRTQVEIIWPQTQSLRTPDRRLALSNDALTLEVQTTAAPALPLERAGLTAQTLTIEEESGSVASLADLSADIARLDTTSYSLNLRAEGVVFSAPLLNQIGRDLPQSFEHAQLDLRATFDRPWDLSAIDTARPQPTGIDLRLLEAQWGAMALRMQADLDIDDRGVPSGDVAIQAQNWQDMMAVAEATGALPPAIARAVSDGLGLLAGLSGNPNSLDVDLTLDGGQIFLGLIPLGPAPRLRLR